MSGESCLRREHIPSEHPAGSDLFGINSEKVVKEL